MAPTTWDPCPVGSLLILPVANCSTGACGFMVFHQCVQDLNTHGSLAAKPSLPVPQAPLLLLRPSNSRRRTFSTVCRTRQVAICAQNFDSTPRASKGCTMRHARMNDGMHSHTTQGLLIHGCLELVFFWPWMQGSYTTKQPAFPSS